MQDCGVRIRLARLTDELGNYMLVPMDHGVSAGPLAGLIDPAIAVRAVLSGGASGIILHKGLVARVCKELRGSRAGLIIHASASTSLGSRPNEKVLVASVATALALGADGFSVHVNLGAETEGVMLEQLGHASDECHRFGLPLLAMVYARGPKIRDPYDADTVAHAARVAEELGADLVKVSYTGSAASFRRVVAAVSIPVLIAGGAKLDTPELFLRAAFDAREAGASGISVGRNIWQAKSPAHMVRALSAVFAGDTFAAAKQLI